VETDGDIGDWFVLVKAAEILAAQGSIGFFLGHFRNFP
jgi:hypothetical protein